MTRRRFYVPRESIQNGSAHLPPDQSHHLRDVLRLGAGEIVEIFDGEGAGYAGEVAFHDSAVVIHRLERLAGERSRARLVLAAALTKPAKFEWMLQKATELGVHEIIPLNTLRSEIGIPADKAASRCERWNRIAREASKQCRRFSVPRVRMPMPCSEMLRREEFSGFSGFLFHQNTAELWRRDAIRTAKDIVLCVGPAGGWDDSEVEEAGRAGYRIFSLGPWVLRAETAAIAAVSVVQYHLNLQSSADSSGENPLK
ncbi:MAG: 16S rRNA (uracil(1498)-N(3))-methyltransferase [Acidobacteria bacterium]|nr:16S rRNA (uracil(1498)-N(3))-methyltransferase [Acidobacteriota bacterium]